MPLIIRILSRLEIITLKGFSLNRAYISIGNPEAKANKVKPLTYITFLYNIPKVVLELGNLIENTSDLRGVGHGGNNDNSRDNNGGQYSGSSFSETAAFLNDVRIYRNIL